MSVSEGGQRPSALAAFAVRATRLHRSPLTATATCTPSTSPSSSLYFVFTLGVGLWVPRHQRSATDYFLGARDLPAWAILLSIVATETSALTVISIPGIGARGDLTFLQLTFGYLIGRIGVAPLAPARLLPRRAGDRLRPAGIAASASGTRRLTSLDLPGHPLPGRRGAGLRQRHPARAGHRLERPDLDRRDGRRHHGLHLVRRLQGGGVDRRAPALGVSRGRRRRAAHRLASGRRRRTTRSAARHGAGKLRRHRSSSSASPTPTPCWAGWWAARCSRPRRTAPITSSCSGCWPPARSGTPGSRWSARA